MISDSGMNALRIGILTLFVGVQPLTAAWLFKDLDVDAPWSPGQAPYNAMTVDSRGYPRVIYAKSADGTVHQYRYAEWTGTAWHYEPIAVETLPVSPVNSVSIALEADGRPNVSYLGGKAGGGFTLTYARGNPVAGGWGNFQSIPVFETGTSLFSVGLGCSIALDSDGRPEILHRGLYNTTAGLQNQALVTYFGGVAWSSFTFVNASLEEQWWGSLQILRYGGGDLEFCSYYSTSKTLGCFRANPETVAADGDVGRFSCLRADASGGIHLLFSDATHGTVRYAAKAKPADGTSPWQIEPVAAGAYGSLAVNSGGQAHAAYVRVEPVGLSLVYARRIGPGNWTVDVVGQARNVARDAIALYAGRWPMIVFEPDGLILRFAYQAPEMSSARVPRKAKKRKATVRGTLFGPVRAIEIANGRKTATVNVDGSETWRAVVKLNPGRNKLRARAIGLFGDLTTDKILKVARLESKR